MGDTSSQSFAADPRGEFPIAPADYIFVLITAITRYRDGQLDRLLRPIGITGPQRRALLMIRRFEPCTMTELSEFSVVDRTTMTRTVDHLVAEGWVERTTRRPDRRQVVHTLTEAGRAKETEAAELAGRLNRDHLVGIPEADQRDLIRLSQGLIANMAPDAPTRERILTLGRPVLTAPAAEIAEPPRRRRTSV